jgi:hypothetical protein
LAAEAGSEEKREPGMVGSEAETKERRPRSVGIERFMLKGFQLME